MSEDLLILIYLGIGSLFSVQFFVKLQRQNKARKKVEAELLSKIAAVGGTKVKIRYRSQKTRRVPSNLLGFHIRWHFDVSFRDVNGEIQKFEATVDATNWGKVVSEIKWRQELGKHLPGSLEHLEELKSKVKPTKLV